MSVWSSGLAICDVRFAVEDLRFAICGSYTALMSVDLSAAVLDNARLSDDYNVLTLAAPAIAAATEPGQFVMVKAGSGHDPLLRRPFSVFEVLSDSDAIPTGISILVKRIGPSTALLYDAKIGDRIPCLGPLGRPFTIVDSPAEAWMVAGGVGLAPFWTLARALVARDVRTTLFYGARRAAELFYLDFFRQLGVTLVLTTEDGSLGERGRVIAPLDRALAARPDDHAVTIYACGPEAMLEAVAHTAACFTRPCEVSVERIMGCGMGGCYSCVVPMKDGTGGFHHVRSCLSGPVLDAAQIVWD
jgi:dihydroorotate dehydrogenase electron transfer subunit